MRVPRINQRVFSAEQLDPRLRAGLVGHWIGGGSGNTWFDRSGYGNHGTLTGGPTWTLGEGGKRNAVQFDGTDDYVSNGQSSVLDFGTNNFSMGGWVQIPVGTTGGLRTIVSKFSSGGLYMQYDTDTGLWYNGWDPSGLFTTTYNITDGRWHHVWFQREGSTTVRFYIDGTLINSKTDYVSTSSNSNTPLAIGYILAIGRYWRGSIDDVRIYNRALSEAEVALLATPSFSPVTPRRFFLGKRSGAAPPPTTSGNFFLMFR